MFSIDDEDKLSKASGYYTWANGKDDVEKKVPIDDNSLSPSQNNVEPKTSWSSMWLAAATSFFIAVQFSIYFASLWPFLSTVRRIMLHSKYVDMDLHFL